MKENIRQEGDEWSDLFPPDGAKDRLKISGTRMRNYRIFSHEMAPKDKLKISGTSLRTAHIAESLENREKSVISPNLMQRLFSRQYGPLGCL